MSETNSPGVSGPVPPAPAPAAPAPSGGVHSMQVPQTPQAQPAAPATPNYGAPAYYAPANKGFFGRLFDFSFSEYNAGALAKLTYILFIAFVWVRWLVDLIRGTVNAADIGDDSDAVIYFLDNFFLGALCAFVMTLVFRLILEFFVASANKAEDARRLRELKEEEAK